MDFPTLATSALAAAQAALPAVDRAYVAGGPDLAVTCTTLAVYPSLASVAAAGPAGFDRPAALGGCAAMAVPQVTVLYAKDCYPMPRTTGQGQGERVVLPDPADVTAWSLAWLADVWALVDGLLEAKYEGSLGGDCEAITVGQGTFTGPRAGICTVRVPVTVS